MEIAGLLVFCYEAERTCIRELEITLNFGNKKFRCACPVIYYIVGS